MHHIIAAKLRSCSSELTLKNSTASAFVLNLLVNVPQQNKCMSLVQICPAKQLEILSP